MAMLREGLRAELPELFELAGRLRPVSIPRMRIWLAVIAALGMHDLSLQLMRGVLVVLGVAGLPPPVRTAEATTIAANALAVLLAYGAAGRRAVLGTIALFAVLWAEQFAVALPGVRLFCERSDPRTPPAVCDLGARAFDQLWPLVAGIVIALALRRLVRGGKPGTGALLVAVGVASVVTAQVRPLMTPFVGPAPGGEAAETALTFGLAGGLAAAILIGAIAGYFGRRHLVNAAIIAADFILPWVGQFKTWLETFVLTRTPRPFVLEIDWRFFVPVGFALAALFALVFAALLRRARLPLSDA